MLTSKNHIWRLTNVSSRRLHKIPHKTAVSVGQEIIMHKKGRPYIGAKRLKRDFDIPCSHGAIHRIMKQNGLIGCIYHR